MNADIARQLRHYDEKYSDIHAFSPMQGSFYRQMDGSGAPHSAQFNLGNANKADGNDGIYNNDLELGEPYYYGAPPYGKNTSAIMGSGMSGGMGQMVGGSGFGHGTYRDTGYGSQEGAGHFPYNGVQDKHDLRGGFSIGDLGDSDFYKKIKVNKSGDFKIGDLGSKDFYNDIRVGHGMSGGFSIGDLGDSDFYKNITVDKPGDFKIGDLGSKDFYNDIQIGKKGSARKFYNMAKKQGGSFFDDLKNFFTKTLPDAGHNAAQQLSDATGTIVRETRKVTGLGKKKGGAILGNPDMYESPKTLADSPTLGIQPRAKAIEEVPQVVPVPAQGQVAQSAPPMQAMGSGKISKKEKDALKSVLEKHGGKVSKAMIEKFIMQEKGINKSGAAKLIKEHGMYKKGMKMGAGFWDDFKRGFNMVFEPGAKYLLKPLLATTGPQGVAAAAGLTALGYGKKKGGASTKPIQLPGNDVVVPKAQMQSSYMSGGGASGGGRAERAAIVKRIMKEKNLKMIDASKFVKANGLYKK